MNNTKQMRPKVILPDWLGSGQDLFGTLQIIKGKSIARGFLEVDYDFNFNDAFNYPVVFEIKSEEGEVVSESIAFRINGNIDSASRVIEEKIIAPKVCNALRREDFIQFLAVVVEKNVDFALYLNKVPQKILDLKFYQLNPPQKLVFNDRSIMEIASVLDQRAQR
ncbi:hypothetical protein A2Y85_08480 [candidate division WOR-3 bacterium RBG_13_43_14]|uniref:Uncharacterized protein n=1 Tax=candidate division WOR-3 bacterium RBG_13_43_14 TaxID=1802590 RepID=A0A1F4UEK7_UNCW3|nr:MAG: hypothetical protein A2Y85_08480 [candidate division WOR-3 bacterium RBG_13_43_14]